MARAIASRAVMKLSRKCRSGRERVRLGFRRPSGRGEKTPHTLGDDERVAAEGDRDMMVPTWESSAFEMVEPKLALEVFVHPLGTPALHDQANQLLLGPPGA